jgi:anaerobic selenocysteine-containing dehydrogenase
MATRRGFLRTLGIAVPAIAVGSGLPDVPAKKTPEFRFACDCGAEVIAPTPEKKGTVVKVACPSCKHQWKLTWRGTHFTTRSLWRERHTDA